MAAGSRDRVRRERSEFRGRVAQMAAASDRRAPTGVRAWQPDLTRSREVRNAARRSFVGGGFASFFAPLRGTNPPCIRLPASVRSSQTFPFWATRPRVPGFLVWRGHRARFPVVLAVIPTPQAFLECGSLLPLSIHCHRSAGLASPAAGARGAPANRGSSRESGRASCRGAKRLRRRPPSFYGASRKVLEREITLPPAGRDTRNV
jgi:hypothetical protein